MNNEFYDDLLFLLDEVPDDYYFDMAKQCQGENVDDVKDINIKDTAIIEQIKKMSEKPLEKQDLEDISYELSRLYDNNIRNNYFVLYSAITDISNQDNMEMLDALIVNIDELNTYAKGEFSENEKIIMGFEKLNQYVKLEAKRASFNKAQMLKLGYATEQYEKQRGSLLEMEQRLHEYEEKLKTAESGYINNLLAVLGVFSGIIIAFFGSLEYMTSVFNNIHNVSKYRLIMVTLIIGFIVFNVVSVMFVCLSKILGKDIYNLCKSVDCSCEKKCTFLKRIKNKLPYVYYVNFFVVHFIIVAFILWCIDK